MSALELAVRVGAGLAALSFVGAVLVAFASARSSQISQEEERGASPRPEAPCHKEL